MTDERPPMTRSARKVLAILHAAGLFKHIDYVTVERTYAGPHQKSIGWATWIARKATGLILCGSQTPIRDLRVGHVDWIPDHGPGSSYRVELMPKHEPKS